MLVTTKNLIMLKDVVQEAKRLWPGLNYNQQIKRFAVIQEKIIEFSSDEKKTNIAFAKLRLLLLILAATDNLYAWQLMSVIESSKEFN